MSNPLRSVKKVFKGIGRGIGKMVKQAWDNKYIRAAAIAVATYYTAGALAAPAASAATPAAGSVVGAGTGTGMMTAGALSPAGQMAAGTALAGTGTFTGATGATLATGTATGGAAAAGGGLLSTAGQETGKALPTPFEGQAASGGFGDIAAKVGNAGKDAFGAIGSWAKNNPQLASQGLQMGGQMLSGYADREAALEDQQDQRRYHEKQYGKRSYYGQRADGKGGADLDMSALDEIVAKHQRRNTGLLGS